jgi:3-oxoadipate enol-lactonase
MHFININGRNIHYKYIQTNGERTFLFINSLGTDFRIWDEVVETLTNYGSIVLYDKRGHGLSDVVDNTSCLEDFADDAIALLHYLAIDKCIPVGLSVGGMIAQLLATRIPEKIERLILCDTRHQIGAEQAWNDRITMIEQKGIKASSEDIMKRWFSEGFRSQNKSEVSGYKNMLERSPVEGYVQTCKAIRDADLTEHARRIALPTLCVVGSEDKSTLPEEVKELSDLIKGSAYHIIQGSGHIPCVDNPEVLSKLIIDFINH